MVVVHGENVRVYLNGVDITENARLVRIGPHDLSSLYQAEKRAEELLMSMLTNGQLDDYMLNGGFDVISQYGHRYRIAKKSTYNVMRHNDLGNDIFCLYIPFVPLHDILIAQKLYLECAEKEFLSNANLG